MWHLEEFRSTPFTGRFLGWYAFSSMSSVTHPFLPDHGPVTGFYGFARLRPNSQGALQRAKKWPWPGGPRTLRIQLLSHILKRKEPDRRAWGHFLVRFSAEPKIGPIFGVIFDPKLGKPAKNGTKSDRCGRVPFWPKNHPSKNGPKHQWRANFGQKWPIFGSFLGSFLP